MLQQNILPLIVQIYHLHYSSTKTAHYFKHSCVLRMFSGTILLLLFICTGASVFLALVFAFQFICVYCVSCFQLIVFCVFIVLF